MAAYEILLLNTAIPQIQAAQSGDTYLVPRDIAFSTVASFAAGAEATPSIVATGDANTGIWFPAADTVAISTGGISRMRLDSSGNFGLGVTPTAAYGGLQIVGPTSASLYTQQGIDVVRTGVRASGRTGIVFDSSDATYTNRMWYIDNQGSAGSLVIGRQGLDVLTMDNSGNLGLGVTPSAWASGRTAIQLGGTVSYFVGNSVAAMSANNFFNGSNAYINNGFATQYAQSSGQHIWFNAPSGTAGAAISFTQAMTLDASGNLGVGTTSVISGARADIRGANANSLTDMDAQVLTVFDTTAYAQNVGGGIAFGYKFNSSGSYIQRGAVIKAAKENGTDGNYATALVFGTSPNSASTAERARITSGGEFLVGTQSQINTTITSIKGTSGTNVLGLQNSNDNNYLITALNSSGTEVFRIAGTGNALNTNGSYGTISDAKMKTDIVDAGSQWDDIKAIRFRKFKMKDDPSGLVQLGVVAQEVELTSPGLVDEHADKDAEGNDLGTTTKSVKTSVLLMKAAVALQEAMARIEKLEAEVAALKGA